MHAEGLVWKGQHNLRLFNQLYWTIVVSYTAVLYGLHISIMVRGNWPAGLSEGKFCLLMEMEVKEEGQSMALMIGQFFVPILMVTRLRQMAQDALTTKMRTFFFWSTCPFCNVKLTPTQKK